MIVDYSLITTKDSLRLPFFLFAPEKKTKKVAMFLHGNGTTSVFYSYDKMKALSDALTAEGIAFFAFNNRGANLIKRFHYIDSWREEVVRNEGTAYELIRECVLDIDAALEYLTQLGYEEFYLIGESTGANKVCVYDFYRKGNVIDKYVLVSGGDDTGMMYEMLGSEVFGQILKESKRQIQEGKGENLIPFDRVKGQIFSYRAFYDMCNPDGDYNCFPFREVFHGWKLSKTQPLFEKFSGITKKTHMIYGTLDEFSWPDKEKVKELFLTKSGFPENLSISMIEDAHHSFSPEFLPLYAMNIAQFLTTS